MQQLGGCQNRPTRAERLARGVHPEASAAGKTLRRSGFGYHPPKPRVRRKKKSLTREQLAQLHQGSRRRRSADSYDDEASEGEIDVGTPRPPPPPPTKRKRKRASTKTAPAALHDDESVGAPEAKTEVKAEVEVEVPAIAILPFEKYIFKNSTLAISAPKGMPSSEFKRLTTKMLSVVDMIMSIPATIDRHKLAAVGVKYRFSLPKSMLDTKKNTFVHAGLFHLVMKENITLRSRGL